MCDLLIAFPDTTKSNKVIFGKNSDRPAGECQVLHHSRGGKHSPGEIRCSYVSVPQEEQTMSVLGCRPYWCWGYETGINEAGVVGGNAAIFTKALRAPGSQQELGLTGMDLLRLGLERGSTAEECVDVITSLLEKYGQWGSAVQGTNHEQGAYDNAFIIADKDEAWFLETAARRWAARRINSGAEALSNQPTIRNEWDKASPDLVDYTRESGWFDGSDENFDFGLAYGDHAHHPRQVSQIRWRRNMDQLQKNSGLIDVAKITSFLRDHLEDTFLNGPFFNRFLPDFHTVCMHDSPAKFTWGNTATSMVVEIDPRSGEFVAFFSYQPPCCSMMLPTIVGSDVPDFIGRTGTQKLQVAEPADVPTDEFAEDSLWWRLYRITETAAKDPDRRPQEIRELLDPLETDIRDRCSNLWGKGQKEINAELAVILNDSLHGLTSAIERLESSWGLVE